jgi:hypothetical protein
MNQDRKNLKIDPEVHKNLCIQAAIHGMKKQELADILLILALSDIENFQQAKIDLLEKKKLKRNI